MNTTFKFIFSLIFLGFLAASCSNPTVADDTAIKAKVPVRVTSLQTGVIADDLTLFATTLYLTRNVVTAPIPAFITRVFVKLGDPVKEGQLLYLLETKERKALGKEAMIADSASASFGKISIYASSSGIISTLDKQQIGDYVLEGAMLCTIAESSALAFAVNVPYEFNKLTMTGAKCTLLMPDNSLHSAHFTTQLTTMNTLSQTETVFAKSDERLFLPENLIVKVLINKNPDVKQQILPKEAVLSDEMMEEYWVMKLINDTTAIKVPITPGTVNTKAIEIISPLFSRDDKFLITGNYGLPDTATVVVQN